MRTVLITQCFTLGNNAGKAALSTGSGATALDQEYVATSFLPKARVFFLHVFRIVVRHNRVDSLIVHSYCIILSYTQYPIC